VLVRALSLVAAVALAGPGMPGATHARVQEKATGPESRQVTARPAPGRPGPEELAPGVLAPGQPPLTEQMVLEMAEALGRVVGAPFTETETNRLRQRALSQWRRSVGYQESIRAAHARLERESNRVGGFPAAAQEAVWHEVDRALRQEAEANPETFLTEAYYRAASVVRDVLVPGDPPLRKNAAQAYYEMRQFVAGLASARPPRLTTTEVLRGGVEVAETFAQSPPDTRRLMAGADKTWAVIRANLARLASAERAALAERASALVTKPGAADLVGRLTPATVSTFFRENGLLAVPENFYWTGTIPAP
jgi:hypothetical protein